MPHVNDKWFRDQLETHGITQRRLARTLKIDPSSVSFILAGKRKIQLDEAAEIARLFDCPLEDVLIAAGIKTAMVHSKGTLTLKGWIDGEYKIHWDLPEGPKSVPLPAFAGKDVQALRYQTTGTALEGMDGVLVYFLDQRDGVASESIGRLSVCITGTNQSRLAVVKRGYGAGLYNLVDMAGRMIEESIMLKSADPVVWIKL